VSAQGDSTRPPYAPWRIGVGASGDSSPFDDGTGDTGDTLSNGWFAEVRGDRSELAINACLWLSPTAANPCLCVAELNDRRRRAPDA